MSTTPSLGMVCTGCKGADMDLKLELILLPVTDVDRAKAFYRDNVGFAVHVDHQASDTFRIVQMDPPGSSGASTSARSGT